MEHKDVEREIIKSAICPGAFKDETYENYFLEYVGNLNDVIAKLEKLGYVCGYSNIPSTIYAAVKEGMLPTLLQEVKEIVNADISLPYTLTAIEPVVAANIVNFHNNPFLNLDGEGTVVAIIDTGIDYLNPQFMDDEGNTRILSIWDQTIITENPNKQFAFGTIYSREQINEAIRAKRNGGDPYAIVPHIDVIGHGTQIAGLAGAKGLDGVVGGAPKCEFVIVKLMEAKANTLRRIGINQRNGLIYTGFDYLEGIRYASEYQFSINKPMAVLLTLGTNLSGHDGVSSIERYVDYYGGRRELVFVSGTGNEGDSSTHAQGTFTKSKQLRTVELFVAENENNLIMSIWFNKPDRVSVGVVSPSGEIIEPVIPKLNETKVVNLVLEESIVTISYSFPEESTGDEFVLLSIFNPEPGLWQIRLRGEYIVNGEYNIWLPQRQLLQPLTRFINSSPYITLMSPAAARSAVTTGFYNQNNNTIAIGSGRGFTRDGRVKPEVATGGINATTTGLMNSTVIVSGSCVGCAVLGSAVLLLLQWGIVLGNDPNMYGPKVRAYISRGAQRRPGDIYPNTEWGFGFLDLRATFVDLRLLRDEIIKTVNKEKSMKNLYSRIHNDINERIIFSTIHGGEGCD